MKKILASVLIAFMVSTMASANEFTVDDITYTLIIGSDEDVPTVLVASSSRSGAVEIPATVTWEDVTYKVEVIGNWAFRDNTGLTSVIIPGSVMSIGAGAFYGCTGLTSVTIPNSVTSIGNMTFCDCVNLTDVTISDSVKTISDGAFSGCLKLTDVTIPGSVTTIGYTAFQGCTGLTSIFIPEGVASIDEDAFRDCTNLNSITFGNAMMSISTRAFSNCTNVTSVTFLGVMTFNNIFQGFGTAESPVTLHIPSLWPTKDRPVNSTTPWHGGYFNCEYVDPVKEYLGTMVEPCANCPAVEIVKGDKKVILYNPDKVEFIKVTNEE